MTLNLSPDQSVAIKGIFDTLFDGTNETHKVAVLTGAAGTGKSTVVEELLNYVAQQLPDQRHVLAAATHRAAHVLQMMSGIEVQTAHAVFKLRPSFDRYGTERFASSGIPELRKGSLVILDEASMIGDRFLKAIIPVVSNLKLKILFVGDHYQLPPTKDKCSLFDGSLPTFTLTQVHRQKGGSPILDKATEYRDYIEGIRTEMPRMETTLNAAGEGIHVLPHNEFVSNFVDKYINYDTGAEVDTPLCTFTNASAINYNSMIRKAAYFLEDTIAPFYPEERLISNTMVKQGDVVILTNNESVIVKGFEESTWNNMRGHTVTLDGDYNKRLQSVTKRVFVPLNKQVTLPVLKELKDTAIKNKSKADWARYYDVLGSLADLRPPFAGTTHKAQGGTFPAVFIDKVNIDKCFDDAVRARLLYVALTRASKDVYINA